MSKKIVQLNEEVIKGQAMENSALCMKDGCRNKFPDIRKAGGGSIPKIVYASKLM